ncbi:MAG: mannitol dehydrogenase family protein [Acidimicrobiales bacterium]
MEPGDLRLGIVHLGLGAFHRAHQAVFTEDAMAATGDRTWGICGVSLRSPAALLPLREQNGLYSVVAREPGDTSARVIATLRGLLFAQEQREDLEHLLAEATTTVVTLTVTEKGYHHDPATGHLSRLDDAILADAAGGSPTTVVGHLVRGLSARRAAGAGPIAVICCDNLPSNGRLLARLVREFCQLITAGDKLATWIDHQVSFPSTVVDRIVPASTAKDRDTASKMIGLRDEAAVTTEPFSQWIIEDHFLAPRPAWERAGAMIVDDVTPWELLKLRMLNGAHSMLAYLGALVDEETIAGAFARIELAEAVQAFLHDDVAPTLVAPDGVDLDAYQGQVLHRFENPSLGHLTSQVAADGSQKLPQRFLATVRDRLAAGAEPTFAALGVAGWMRYVSARSSDHGVRLVVNDPMAAYIARLLASDDRPAVVVRKLLGIHEIFGEDLTDELGFAALLTEHLTVLSRDGSLAAAHRALGGLK